MATRFLPFSADMDISTIYHLACQRLGNYEFKEGSPVALAMHREYPYVLRLANAVHDWSFCLVRKAIASDKGRDYRGGRILFPLPHGCIKLKRIMQSDARTKIKNPELVAQGVTVGEDGADGIVIDYQADLVSVAGEIPDRNPAFCDAVIALLAGRIAMNITGSAELAQMLEQEANRQFRNAIAHDKQQDWSNDKSPLELLRSANIFRER